MRIGLGVRSLFAGLLAVIPHAHAAVSIEKLQIQGETVLVVRGEFEFGDKPEALSAAVAQSGARVVTFNSNGGNVHAAMAFGRTIRALGLATVQLRGSGVRLRLCACVRGWCQANSRTGFHRSPSILVPGRRSA